LRLVGPRLEGLERTRRSEGAGAVVGFIAPFKARVQCINCDSTGIGHYFPVALAGEGYRIRPVNFGAAAEAKGKSW
jgi:hypothetical protein